MPTSINIQTIKGHTAVIEAQTGRKCYAYVLNVNGEPFKFTARDWWSDSEKMQANKIGMAVTAHVFKKTASILVYELHDDNRYYLCDTCCRTNRDRFAYSFHKDAKINELLPC